jgi:hypothetical protein
VAAGIAAAAALAVVATATAKTTGQTTTTVRRRVPGAGAAIVATARIAAVRVHAVAAVMGRCAIAQAGAAAPVTGEPPGNPEKGHYAWGCWCWSGNNAFPR